MEIYWFFRFSPGTWRRLRTMLCTVAIDWHFVCTAKRSWFDWLVRLLPAYRWHHCCIQYSRICVFFCCRLSCFECVSVEMSSELTSRASTRETETKSTYSITIWWIVCAHHDRCRHFSTFLNFIHRVGLNATDDNRVTCKRLMIIFILLTHVRVTPFRVNDECWCAT